MVGMVARWLRGTGGGSGGWAKFGQGRCGRWPEAGRREEGGRRGRGRAWPELRGHEVEGGGEGEFYSGVWRQKKTEGRRKDQDRWIFIVRLKKLDVETEKTYDRGIDRVTDSKLKIVWIAFPGTVRINNVLERGECMTRTWPRLLLAGVKATNAKQAHRHNSYLLLWRDCFPKHRQQKHTYI
jgi:hypothetical protein